MNEVADYAAKAGISCYIRNEFWGYMRGENVVKFMDMLDGKIGFSPDLCQLYIAHADAVSLIEKFSGRVGFMNVNDTFYTDEFNYFDKPMPEAPAEGNNQRVYCDLGNGAVDVVSAYKAYEKAGGEWAVFNSKESFNHVKAMVKMQVYANKHLCV